MKLLIENINLNDFLNEYEIYKKENNLNKKFSIYFSLLKKQNIFITCALIYKKINVKNDLIHKYLINYKKIQKIISLIRKDIFLNKKKYSNYKNIDFILKNITNIENNNLNEEKLKKFQLKYKCIIDKISYEVTEKKLGKKESTNYFSSKIFKNFNNLLSFIYNLKKIYHKNFLDIKKEKNSNLFNINFIMNIWNDKNLKNLYFKFCKIEKTIIFSILKNSKKIVVYDFESWYLNPSFYLEELATSVSLNKIWKKLNIFNFLFGSWFKKTFIFLIKNNSFLFAKTKIEKSFTISNNFGFLTTYCVIKNKKNKIMDIAHELGHAINNQISKIKQDKKPELCLFPNIYFSEIFSFYLEIEIVNNFEKKCNSINKYILILGFLRKIFNILFKYSLLIDIRYKIINKKFNFKKEDIRKTLTKFSKSYYSYLNLNEKETISILFNSNIFFQSTNHYLKYIFGVIISFYFKDKKFKHFFNFLSENFWQNSSKTYNKFVKKNINDVFKGLLKILERKIYLLEENYKCFLSCL